LLSSGVARADPIDVRAFGVFFGYAWGKEPGVEWGFETIATHYFEDVGRCGSQQRAGYGPVLRLTMIGKSRLELTGALHAGGESTRSVLAFDGEVGGTLAFGKAGLQGSLHTGASFETLVFNMYARQRWLMSSYSMGGGVRYLPTFGELGICSDGRPFRAGDGQAQTAQLLGAQTSGTASPEARRWARRAAEECASVPAFLQLAHELLGLDAPIALVARALDAAEEELGHTWAASRLASRFGGTTLVATPPRFSPRAALPRPRALERLARESWADGWLNEGLAARIAAAEADASHDAEETAVCARIAREEAGHAELAFDVLRWLSREAPEVIGAALAAANEPLTASLDSQLGDGALRELAHDHARSSRARLAELT
jgi:hypothetical protein